MYLTASNLAQLTESQGRRGIVNGAHRQGDKHFVGVEPWIFAAQVVDFQLLNGRNRLRGDKLNIVVNAAQNL